MANTYNVASYAQLVNAINNAVSGDIINITADNITLEAALPAITKDLTFTSAGQNATISGGDQYRVFTVNSGNVTFTNLTIADGLAKGATGATNDAAGAVAGNGGVGQGGGLLLNGGAVTLINMNFQGNQAIGGQGGNSLNGTAGNGGDGQGGAIYVNGGTLRINNTSFKQNSAVAGTSGNGKTAGQSGKSQGGGLFVNAGSVIAEGNPRFGSGAEANTALQGIDTFVPVASNYQVFEKPVVQSISRANNAVTGLSSVEYTVTFSQDVTGVDQADFLVTETSAGTIVGEGIIAVTPGANARTYTVQVNTGSGNGSLRLDLKDNDSIRNSNQIPIGGTGLDNGNLPGQVYTIDKTPPAVVVERKNNALQQTAADTVVYTVRFGEPVSGIITGNNSNGGTTNFKNFQLLVTGGISGEQILSVTPQSSDVNTNTAYDVVVKTGSGNGTIALQLLDDDSVVSRSRGIPLGGTGAGNGDVTGPTYQVDKTPPFVGSIVPIGNSTTGSATVQFQVTFTQDVTGVTTDDFKTVTSGGASSASVVSVAATDPRTYTITVNTGSGDGNVGLNLVDNDSIKNALGVALGGSGSGNGNFTGPTYSVLKSAPLVSAINLANPNTTASGAVTFNVIFNQDVKNVDATDFQPIGIGLTGFGITSVSGSGKSYAVTVNTGSGSGSLGLNLIDNDSIANVINNPLGGVGAGNGSFTGQVYTINKVPPRVTAINRLEPSPTNVGTINYTVSFSEAVSRVDSSDFTLETQGLTGAGITSVTRVNDTFYSVAINTGVGEGTVRLSLTDNDSIVNGLGLPLGGAGSNNGTFRGEVYTIDRTAPIGDIVDIVPDPIRDKVDAITIRFNEAVRGFDLADLRLTRDGSPLALDRANLTSADGITWSFGNLQRLTNKKGNYSLVLAASGSGITDLAGNALNTSLGEQWTNLVSIEVCEPGITKRGTKGANRLEGTENSDSLLGLAGNDTLLGLDCRDRLDGDDGNDRLVGGEGRDVLLGGADDDLLEGGTEQDVLNGGAGSDRLIYSGSSQDSAFANSLADAPDRVKGFKSSQSDKFQLDYDDNLNSKNRPSGLFHAGSVKGKTLANAVKNAYGDKNQATSGSQRLGTNQAVFLDWQGGTYLSVNNGDRSFSANQDLVINVTGIQLKSGDANSGSLDVANYFI